MTLRRVTALRFPDIEPGGADMARPTYADVDPNTLLVDEDYQRNLSERSRSLIRRILTQWDWRAFKPPIVVETATGMHVIDGQHTAIAAASHPKVGTIPVQVVEAVEVQDRASAFVRHNRDRIAITPAQLHHAMVAAGDEDALTIAQVCQRAGVNLMRQPRQSGTYQPGDCISVSTIRGVVSRRHAIGARRILDVCVAARLAPISAAAIRAVEFLLYAPDYAGKIEPFDIATALRDSDCERQGKIYHVDHKVPIWLGLAVVLSRNITRKQDDGHPAQA